jgi:hypothetical protein
MQTYSWIVGAVALGINVHALVAFVRGLRARDADAIARHARRCGWSAAGFAVLLGAGLAASVLMNDAHRQDTPADRAARLGMTISEIMNTVAFGVVVAALPSIAAVVLRLRAARARK